MGLLDEDQRAVVGHLQVTLRLGEADDLRFGLVQTQLGRIQHRQQGRMIGEDSDRADRRPRRDHLDLVVEDLALGRQDLDRELRMGHYSSPSSPPWPSSAFASVSASSFSSAACFPSSPESPRASLTTSSIVPLRKKARSGRSSCLPSRISLKPRIDSSTGTYTPGVPVNCSATKNGCDRKRSSLRARLTVRRSSSDSSSIPRIAMMS